VTQIDPELPIDVKFSRAMTKVTPKYLNLKDWGKYHSKILEQNFNSGGWSGNLGVLMKVQRMKNKLKSVFLRDKLKKDTEKRSRFYDKEAKKKSQEKRTMKMMVKLVINFLRVLKKIKVSLPDLLKWPVFPTEAYAIEGCKNFFMYVKTGNLNRVRQILSKNRYFVFQIDSVRFLQFKNF
jgi:hypothetical protein